MTPAAAGRSAINRLAGILAQHPYDRPSRICARPACCGVRLRCSSHSADLEDLTEDVDAGGSDVERVGLCYVKNVRESTASSPTYCTLYEVGTATYARTVIQLYEVSCTGRLSRSTSKVIPTVGIDGTLRPSERRPPTASDIICTCSSVLLIICKSITLSTSQCV